MHRAAPGPLVLTHPPAVSRRYLKTKFPPYGMGVLAAFLRARHREMLEPYLRLIEDKEARHAMSGFSFREAM